MKKHYSQAAEQNDWQEFKPLFGGGKIKICDTIRAVTPFGGLSVFIEFLGRIGLVEQLTERLPYQPQSPNHYQPGQILIGFMLSVIAGARRFAHSGQLRALVWYHGHGRGVRHRGSGGSQRPALPSFG